MYARSQLELRSCPEIIPEPTTKIPGLAAISARIPSVLIHLITEDLPTIWNPVLKPKDMLVRKASGLPVWGAMILLLGIIEGTEPLSETVPRSPGFLQLSL
jgi:hypothetical protein